MNKATLIQKIETLKSDAGMWDVSLNEQNSADFVIGYFYNSNTERYDVFVNNERGRQRVRLSTVDEIEALEKVLSLLEFEAETTRRNKRMS